MKKILLMAVAAGSLFACNKQDPAETENVQQGESTVTLSIAQDALSKSVENEKGNGTEYAVIGSAKIYFLDVSNNSIYQRELTALEIADLTNTTTTAGGKTIVITGVPSAAIKLYFMANIKTIATPAFPAIDGTTSADARLRIDKLQTNNALYAPMSGISTDFIPAAGTNQFTTSVLLTPIVARLEIGQVTYQNQNGEQAPAAPADITKYTLSGVFINNVRQSVMLSGAPYTTNPPIDIRNQSGWTGGWASYFTAANTIFPYFDGGSPVAPTDWVANAMINYCTPQGNPALVFYPDATYGSTSTDPGVTPKRAWAYQVCPSTVVPPLTPADVPHIILKLTNVDYLAPELTNSVQYVTVTKYKTTADVPVTAFERGNVYRIENLIFSETQATDQPYLTDITVTATVSVVPWKVVTIKPDWD